MIIRDVNIAIRTYTADMVHRSIILMDHRSNSSTHVVGATMHFPYEGILSEDAVSQLFDETVKALLWDTSAVVDVEAYPIIRYVGPYKVTLITRTTEGTIVISDAENRPTDSYIGME